jgi:cytochrome c oxidase subunit 4
MSNEATNNPITPEPTLHAHAELLAHPVSPRLLVAVFAALMVLTFITIAATWVDIGVWNVWLALLIAVVKAGLVAMYFMHLRWDNPFNGIVLIASLFFVALLIGSVVLDSREYKVNYTPPAGSAAGVTAP